MTDDTLKHTYDELGRLERLEIVDDATTSSASWYEAYGYDARGRIVEVDNNLGTFTSTYAGESNRVTATDYPNGMRVEYDYFDANGDFLLKQIKNLSSTPSVISQFDYTYNQDRTIDTWEIYQSSTGTTTWTFGYDAAQQLTDAVRRDPSLNIVEEEHYGYDAAANRIWVTTATTARTYTVNALNQLVAERGFGKTLFAGTVDEPATVTVNGVAAVVRSTAGAAPYRFEAVVDLPEGTSEVVVEATDGSSNVSTQTYEVTRTGTTTLYEYDLNGNLVAERDCSGVVKHQYSWNQADLIAGINDANHTIDFEYDGHGRRRVVVVREDDQLVESAQVILCRQNQCEARIASTDGDRVQRSFLHGNVTESIASYETRDHLGSVRETLASSSLVVLASHDYTPFGEYLSSVDVVSLAQTFAFQRNSLSGLLSDYRAYDPATGRWRSREPLGELESVNLYSYVHNSPTVYVDPSGLAGKRNGSITTWRDDCDGGDKVYCTLFCAGKAQVYNGRCYVQYTHRPIHVGWRDGFLMERYRTDRKVECSCDEPKNPCGSATAACVAIAVCAAALLAGPGWVLAF